MHPDALKELLAECDELEAAEAPDECYPRLFYFGHDLLYTIESPPKKWKAANGKEFECYSRSGCWRCRSCKHEWISEDGETCPACGAISKN